MSYEMALEYVKVEEIPEIVNGLQDTFVKKVTRPLPFRKHQLRRFYELLDENESVIFEALKKDLRKPSFEAELGETAFLKEEILTMMNNLDKWAAPEYVKVGSQNAVNSCHIRKEPVGMALIIGAWNYPITNLLGPLVGAIGAGCTVLIKPSEVAEHTAALLAELVPKYLDQRCYRIVNGGVDETTALLEQRFDHIFFIGSNTVGRIIMAAAAKHMTRVTLECGGKNPTIIAKDADPVLAAKRICWGKFFNCGQTCIAPDYVLVERPIHDRIVKEFSKATTQMYGTNSQNSPDYARIINPKRFDTIADWLKRSRGKVVAGGQTDREDLYIAPTVVDDVPIDDSLMEDEIFGPILPIVVIDSLEEAFEYLNARSVPLTLYAFSKNKKTIQHILDNTRSGGAVTNDVLIHFSVSSLPFGGLGQSGFGAYHGKQSFMEFTHERSTMNGPNFVEKLLEVRYPPYTERNMNIIRWTFLTTPHFKRSRLARVVTKFVGALIIVAVAYAVKSRKLPSLF